MKSFRRQSSSSVASGRSGNSSSSGRREDGSGDTSGRPLGRWLSKTNSLLEQITNAPGARGGQWEEEEMRAREEAKRVSCPNCQVAFADKSALRQHYVLFPAHNPGWTGKGPDFPSSPSSASSSSFSSGPRSRTSSRASSGTPHHFNTNFDQDDESPASDEDERPETSPLNNPTTQFASQFSKLHPTFYERDIVVRQDNSDPKDGGPVAKIIIGPGYGTTWTHQKHARTTSLSNPSTNSANASQPGTSSASEPLPGHHTRSYSVDVASTSHNLIGFDDDFSGHQGVVKRAPLARSATEPAIHFDSIEEHDEHHSPDEDNFSDDDHLDRPSTPSHGRRRRDSFESDDTYLATPARQNTAFAPQMDDSSDGHRSDDQEEPDHDPDNTDHVFTLEDRADNAETPDDVDRDAHAIDEADVADRPVITESTSFDAAFEEAFGAETSATPSPGAPAEAPEQRPAPVLQTPPVDGTRKVHPRPAAPAPPPATASRSSLASRPAPPPPPPTAASSSLSSRKPPAPPPSLPSNPASTPVATALPKAFETMSVAGDTGTAAQATQETLGPPAQPQKKKRAPPPPPPPRRGASSRTTAI